MLDMALSVLESEIDIVKNEIQIPEAAGRLSIEELSEKSRRQDGKYDFGIICEKQLPNTSTHAHKYCFFTVEIAHANKYKRPATSQIDTI